MELRYYWRVLVRRRNIIRNTVLIVALLGLVTVAYSYLGAQYLGSTIIGVQVQPNPNSRASVVDPSAAAYGNTDQVIHDLTAYAGTTDYFHAISSELKNYHINKDYKAVGQGLKVFASSEGHSIFIQWPGSSKAEAARIVAVAGDQLQAYVPVYHTTLAPKLPTIRTSYVERPTGEHVGLTKPLIDFLLRVVIGLVAGIILAYLFEYLDDNVQDAADVERWMHVPTLAVIPGGRQARRVRSA